MKFSVFTPTHDTTHLIETYKSLLAQTHRNWEWVIVVNNGATLPPELDDTRIQVYEAPTDAVGVGALKRFACSQCEGEYLVELDHDDILMPQALAKLALIIELREPDFVYSDAAQFRANGDYQLFDKKFGWEHYEVEGHKINRSFEPTASSLREIFYAPDHLRAWRRETYWRVGGHDQTLEVCDDFDLVLRTYLSGASFRHLAECLYLYRIREDGNNTWLKRNADIQTKQRELSNKYTHPLVHEWCRREGLKKLDLGGATGCPEGFQSLDLRGGVDLRRRWPYPDSSIGVIRAYDFLEHIPHCKDSSCTHVSPFCTVGLMNEIYRVLVPGGWLLSATPSTEGRGAFQDPTHCSFWNSNSFWYFTREQQRQYVPGICARFQAARLWTEAPTDWHKTHQILYVYADLVALKGQRQPGIVEV